MMILPSSSAILTPRMIHTQQKYLLWPQRKNVPSVSLEVSDCWQGNSVARTPKAVGTSLSSFEWLFWSLEAMVPKDTRQLGSQLLSLLTTLKGFSDQSPSLPSRNTTEPHGGTPSYLQSSR